jgi:hypothetical protein
MLWAERTLNHTPRNKTQSTELVLISAYFTIMDGNGWVTNSLYVQTAMAPVQDHIHPHVPDTWY